jgi:hypothetical protein
VQKILEDVLLYVQNAFGNFVVSEVLSEFSFEISKDIFNEVKGYYV